MAARKFKITNSVGVYDMYKTIRKNGWYNIGRPLKEHEFYTIVRSVNKLLAENFINGEPVVFPACMGRLELRKYPRGVSFVDGRLRNTYPIDWGNTRKLWAMDEEARKENILLRFEIPMVYHTRYCKEHANYRNKVFYQFRLLKKLRSRLKDNIINDKTDTLW